MTLVVIVSSSIFTPKPHLGVLRWIFGIAAFWPERIAEINEKSTLKSAEIRLLSEIKGKNALNIAESRQGEEIRGKSTLKSAEIRLLSEIKGKNALKIL